MLVRGCKVKKGEGGLWKVVKEELTFRDMHSVSREPGSLPHQTALLRQQWRHLSRDQLVADRLLAIRVQLVLIAHVPRPRRVAVVIGHRLLRVRVLCLLREEGVAVVILFGSDLARALGGVDLEDRVVWTIDVRVDTETEEMLMVVGVDAGVDFCAPAFGIFAGIHRVCVQDACQLDFQLHGAVLVEDPIYAVLVVRGREDVRDDELSRACDNHGVRLGSPCV